MPNPSLFAAIAPQPLQTFSRPTMLAMSHAIEDQALAAGPIRLLVALFQHGRNLSRASARYRHLRDHADRVVIVGYDLVPDDVPGATLVELSSDDPLRDEWAIMVLGDDYQALLATQEVARDDDGTGRRYEGAWTFDPTAVRAAALVLRGIVRAYRPEAPFDVPRTAGSASNTALEAGASRMLAYVERGAERTRARERELTRALADLERTNEEMVTRLAIAAEMKDQDTGGHLWRVRSYTTATAGAMKLPASDIQRVTLASTMHDIGKVHIRDDVLRKPGTLTEEEFDHVKTHTLSGARILAGSPSALLQCAERIARSHHERWDGNGYPDGLRGAHIPLEARVVAVADVFDALTVRRPYKDAFPIDQSLAIIRESRGLHFDPDVVDAFFSVEHEIRRIAATGDSPRDLFLDSTDGVAIAGSARPRG